MKTNPFGVLSQRLRFGPRDGAEPLRAPAQPPYSESAVPHRKALLVFSSWLTATVLCAALCEPARAQVAWGELFEPPPRAAAGGTAAAADTRPSGSAARRESKPAPPSDTAPAPAAVELARLVPAARRSEPTEKRAVHPAGAAPAPPVSAPRDEASAGAPAAARPQAAAPPPHVAAAPPQAGARQTESAHLVPLASLGLTPGQAIDAENAERFQHLLNPGMQWAVTRGWRIEVAEPAPIVAPRAYREATEKYAAQTRLATDGLALENHVAGRPFVHIDPSDPDAVRKIMWNYYFNFHVIDDVVLRDFHPRTGTIGEDGSMQVERAYVVDSYRKLNYTARLYVEPKPELPNPEGVRFKESVHPIVEPFDLKGVGFTAYRYLDPNKQDDSWLYLPQLRRVRRMSSAQRSDALFGQDTDADSYGGYNGHIAWMDYRLLGERTVLAPVHARNCPLKWGKPHDWTVNDVWEPRRVWVVEARPKLAQYAYGKRVLFVDQESFLIPLTDSYDRAGQLWKSQVNVYAQRTAEGAAAVLSRYPEPMVFQLGTVVMDTQLEHATTSSMPSELARRPDTYLLNSGPKGGTTEDYFTVAHMMASAK